MYNRIGIFYPVYFREDLAIKSLESLLKSNFKPLEVFLAIGINGSNKKFRDFLKDYIINNSMKFKGNKFSYIDVFDPNINFGKPKIINAMSLKNEPAFDFLVSMDSDIQITDSDWLLKMLHVFNTYTEDTRSNKKLKRLGALCANQEGHSVHQLEKYGKISLKVKDYTLRSTLTNQGVAGGILLTPKSIWNEIGGYKATNLYGSDDGSYAIDCNRLNYIMAYVEEIKCFHPVDENIKYAEWKARSVNGELHDKEKRGFFEEMRHGNI